MRSCTSPQGSLQPRTATRHRQKFSKESLLSLAKALGKGRPRETQRAATTSTPQSAFRADFKATAGALTCAAQLWFQWTVCTAQVVSEEPEVCPSSHSTNRPRMSMFCLDTAKRSPVTPGGPGRYLSPLQVPPMGNEQQPQEGQKNKADQEGSARALKTKLLVE